MKQRDATYAHAREVMTRTVAGRPATVHSEVTVPLLTAIVTALAIGCPFGAALGVFAARLLGDGDEPVIVLIGAGGLTLVVFLCAWLYSVRERQRLLWALEKHVHYDLDGDKRVGAPPSPVRAPELRVQVSHHDDTGRLQRVQLLSVPGVTPEQLRAFAEAVAVQGRPLAVTQWTGAGALFSRTQYDRLMAELIRAGLVADHGTQGRALTVAGRNVLREAARQADQEREL